MKVHCIKKGQKWQVNFATDNIDPSGLVIAGNFNEWQVTDNTLSFGQELKEVQLSLPKDTKQIAFKVFDSNKNAWCEVYDNGELYAGLEPYFVANEMGTINIVIPLVEESKPAAAKKPAAKKAPATETTKAKPAAKKTAKKA
jgi:hypothetical protein